MARWIWLGLIALALLGYGSAQADGAEGNACPAGDVKYEAAGGYEYGEQWAEITLAGPVVTWRSYGRAIAGVCVKAGSTLYAPEVTGLAGTFTVPDGKDASHVVLKLEGPTAVTLAGAPQARRGAVYWLGVVLFFGLGAVCGALLMLARVGYARRRWYEEDDERKLS